jgi:DNA-binding NarL/FixJ family response regulator
MENTETVLVVDTDDQARMALARVLTTAGYGVVESRRGDEGLELARSIDPAAVVLEVPLPGLSGYEVCHELKADPSFEAPVVFVSGARTEAYDRIAGLLLNADDYIVKPYEAGELLARLRNLIRRFRARVPSAASLLTKREEEVLELMADGLRQGEIARRLFISPKTVATHVEHILRKLGARSSTEAVSMAYRAEIIRSRLVRDAS